MTEAPFSSVPGFRLRDFDTACPTTGQQCPAQENLVSRYVGNAGEESVNEDISLSDRAALMIKLGEYKVVSRLVTYPGQVSADSCPSLESIRTSKVRPTVVKSIRGLLGKKYAHTRERQAFHSVDSVLASYIQWANRGGAHTFDESIETQG